VEKEKGVEAGEVVVEEEVEVEVVVVESAM
jgi:hypothetical protein